MVERPTTFGWVASRMGKLHEENHGVSGFAFDENQDWTGDQFARCFCASNPNAAECDDAPPPLISLISKIGT